MEEKYVLLGRIFASRNRFNVLFSLSEGLKTPSKISTDLGLHLSYVSKILGELGEMKLVECKNQKLMKGRIYGLTDSGRETVKEIKNMKMDKKEG
ncbi:MAG TPA: transcriptional regulator [Patescibacteria group bacterium]|nr:transcriptional regulator [Patescibacteria group bacterium]